MGAHTRHLKRSSMPTAWPVKRKNITFIARPQPGAHKREYACSVLVLLRDVLGYVKTNSEAVFAVKTTEILVNGQKVDDIRKVCGLFDLFEIKATKEKFTVLFDANGKLKLVPTKDDVVVAKVVSKTLLRGKKYQLNLFNGANVLVDEKKFNAVAVNDSITYDVSKKKIVDHISLKEGVFVYIFDGKFTGQFAEVKGFISYSGITKDIAQVQIGSDVNDTAKEYCYAIGTKKEDVKRFE